MKAEKVSPISHNGYRFLNKRVTILGYPPLFGGLLILGCLVSVIFAVSYKNIGLGFLSAVYVGGFATYTAFNIKRVKKKKLDLMSVLSLEHKLKTFNDPNGVINMIKSND